MAANKTIGRNTNKTDIAVLDSVSVGSGASVKVVDANEARIGLVISNPNNQACWIKEQSASIDNDKKGYYVIPGGKYIMPTDNIYTGEVSAIFASGGSKTLYWVEK